MASFGDRLAKALARSRAAEWWEFKLLPMLAVLYAGALACEMPPRDWLVAALQLIGSVIPGAAFVSVINDISDREDDLAAGKPNRMATASPAAQLLIPLALVGAGLCWCFVWRNEPSILIPYVCAWIAFSLYSLPPIRLKSRGWAGVVADAAGAHLFPTMVAIAIIGAAAGWTPAPWLTITLGVWALAYGLRGIFWHQLCDREGDIASGARTLAVRLQPGTLERWTHWVIFPLEVVSLAILLGALNSALAWLLLGIYAANAVQRIVLWRMIPVLVAPREKPLMVLEEYYSVYLPLALLFSLALRSPLIGSLGALLHLALFPINAWRVGKDFLRLEWVQAKVIYGRLSH